MFYQCSLLKELNLSNFNTNNVNNMSYMFYRCSSLKEFHSSNFNIYNANMAAITYECSDEMKKIIKEKIKTIKV